MLQHIPHFPPKSQILFLKTQFFNPPFQDFAGPLKNVKNKLPDNQSIATILKNIHYYVLHNTIL